MSPRFTPATEQALRAAEWFPNRTVSDEQMSNWLIINWCPDLTVPQGYTRISPMAWRALNEFGGLTIERGTDEKPPFVVNPLRVPDLINPGWRWDTIAWQLGTDLFPLGTIEFNSEERTDAMSRYRAVFMGNDGRVFIQAHPVYCLGNTIDEALERVVAGERGEPLPGVHDNDSDSKGINNAINKLIERREKQLMLGIWPDQPTTLHNQKDSLYGGLLSITDWDFEAKRICRAFGIIEPCVFVGPLKGKFLRPATNRLGFNDELPSLGEGLFLRVTYSWTRTFKIVHRSHKRSCSFEISWRDYFSGDHSSDFQFPAVFLKGLFNLGFLTPEVEAKLNLAITQHEKLEWQLEFEALNNQPETETR